ncbi:MAG: hypothetical protein ACOYN4_00925 [Bacteroidales bacterium]
MMDKELWDKCQILIDGGLVELIVDLLVKEVEDNLNPEQLKPLGELRPLFIKMFSEKRDISAEKFLAGFIDLAKRGVIKERRTD